MKSYTKILLTLLAIVILVSCQDYNELVKNKNVPTSVPPGVLLAEVLNRLNNQNAWDGKQGSQSAAQFFISTYDYYGTNNYDQTPFTKTENNFEYVAALQNIKQMELEASKSASTELNPYTALGKFLKAYYYNLMSQKLGDIPLSEALLGSENKTPKYDTQKQVYVQILKWLDESNSDLTQLIEKEMKNAAVYIVRIFLAMPFLDNNLSAWQKVVNSFTLRVLISLSKKENEPDLNIKQKFAAIVSNPAKYPVFTGLSDNLQYTYNLAYNNYPKNPTSQGRDATRENVGSTFYPLTTSLKDPRTFVAATPAPALLAEGKLFSDYAAYAGAPAGLSMSELGINAQGGKYSYINALRYYADFAGSKAEPAIIIGYPELCFNIAEGINRGWATGNASTWYTNGITASMNFLGITEGGSIKVGDLKSNVYGTVTNISIANYLAQPDVQYKGGADGLATDTSTEIYCVLAELQLGSFFNQRRTGVPSFSEGVGSGNGNKIAKRWQYPVAEVNANSGNYNAAIQRQFNGKDDLNSQLWILE